MESNAITVVVYEEHPLMTLGMRTVLESGGATVTGAAESLPDLNEILRERKPCVAVLDIALYSQERYTLLHQLHTDYPEVALVVLSVHHEESVAKAAIAAGASAYLLKTESPASLVQAVDTACKGNVYYSELLERGDAAQSDEPKTPIDLLTESELGVLKLVGKGFTLRKIADDTNRPIELVERDHWQLRKKLELEEPEDLLEFAAHWVHHEGGFS